MTRSDRFTRWITREPHGYAKAWLIWFIFMVGMLVIGVLLTALQIGLVELWDGSVFGS